MWYLILLFIIVFEAVLTLFAPYFPGVSTSGELATTTANTTSELIATGINPFDTFIDIMTFQLEGGQAFSILFVVLDIIFVACIVIPLIRGK